MWNWWKGKRCWEKDTIHVYGYESLFILLNALFRRDKKMTLDKCFWEDGLGYCTNIYGIIQKKIWNHHFVPPVWLSSIPIIWFWVIANLKRFCFISDLHTFSEHFKPKDCRNKQTRQLSLDFLSNCCIWSRQFPINTNQYNPLLWNHIVQSCFLILCTHAISFFNLH